MVKPVQRTIVELSDEQDQPDLLPAESPVLESRLLVR